MQYDEVMAIKRYVVKWCWCYVKDIATYFHLKDMFDRNDIESLFQYVIQVCEYELESYQDIAAAAELMSVPLDDPVFRRYVKDLTGMRCS